MNYYLECFKKYATFAGRARRKEYWMFVLFNAIAAIVLSIIGSLLGRGAAMLPYILTSLYGLVVLIPNIAVTVRRLHDTGRSGAWWWIQLVPFIGGIWLFVLMCLDGERKENQYGPDPKAGESAAQA